MKQKDRTQREGGQGGLRPGSARVPRLGFVSPSLEDRGSLTTPPPAPLPKAPRSGPISREEHLKPLAACAG